MRSFILLTFLFMGLAYYELSGGNEFVPETRPDARVAQVETTPLAPPEVITREDTTDPADVNALPAVADRLAQPLVAPPPAETAVAEALAEALASPAPDLPQTEEAPVLVSLVAPRAEWRVVDASALNVRAGPSTNDSVVARLSRNEQVQVISELDDGWTLVRVGDAGTEGWVASRFLTP